MKASRILRTRFLMQIANYIHKWTVGSGQWAVNGVQGSGFSVRNSPLSTLHSPLSTLHSQLSTLHSPLSTLHSPLAIAHRPLPTAHCPLLHPSSFILHFSSPKKAAFSILEVILALAILTGAMVVLGELGRLGFRNAKATQDLTKALLLCESKMAEYTSGITTPQAVSGASFDTIDQDTNTNVSWTYSVSMETVDSDGLIALCVTVTQNLPGTQHPTSFTMTRWILDPSLGQSTSSSDTSSTSTTGSTTGSTTNSATGTINKK